MSSKACVSKEAGSTKAPVSSVKVDHPGTGFLSFDGSQRSYLKYVSDLALLDALWWFIENVHDELPERSEIFFSLRERMAKEGCRAAQSANEVRRIASLVIEGDDEAVLDGVVLDECTAFAAGVNNDGAEAQVKYLLAAGWTEATILKEAGVNKGPGAPSPCP